MAIASRAANAKAAKRIPLIIPVESQVRELDAKLLLACVAVRRNFPVVIGRMKAIDAHRGEYILPRAYHRDSSPASRPFTNSDT